MRPKTAVDSVVHGTPKQHASGSSKLVKPPLEIDCIRSRHPVFSDESSETEYTSEEDAPEDVESKPKEETLCSQDEAPTSVALSSISNIKTENLTTPQQQGSLLRVSSVNGDGRIVARPSISIPRDRIKSTPLIERRETKDGKTIVVVDLGDSDEETETEIRPLCSHCHLKAVDNEEVHTPKVSLVVDLSGTDSQVNHAHVSVTMLKKNETLLMTPVASKAETSMNFSREHMKTVSFNNGKQVEAETDLEMRFRRDYTKTVPNGKQAKVMEFSEEQMKRVALKSNGKQAGTVMDVSKDQMKAVTLKSNGKQTVEIIRREHMKSVKESPSKPHVGFSPEALRASTEKLKETTLFIAAEESEDEASTLSEDYRRGLADGHHVEMIQPDWSADVLCDLCERGPSLSLGAWYSWCCGFPSLNCKCSYEDQQRKKKTLKCKGGKSWKATDPPYPWSGKVHKLCGLWSAEVFEDSNQPWRIMKLWAAVQRSRKSKCSDPDCGLFGATLGCRVASCRKNFHYPCADKLSFLVKLRMWDGLIKPIACKDHLDVDDVLDDVKFQKEKSWMPKKRKRGGKKILPASTGAGPSKLEERTSGGVDVINIDSSGEEDSPHRPTAPEVIPRLNTPNTFSSRLPIAKRVGTPDSLLGSGPKPYGTRLLCTDFSGGLEPIEVPCTNDVDDEPPPYLEYITKSRYQGEPLGSRNHSHPLFERQAKACDGCALHDPDDPFAPISVHIPFERRQDDFREDWLRERMYGRLPYDKYARLVIGTDYNELVECNDRCKCGDSCINREMQKGLRTPIELYKTDNKGWAVRTLVPVPRGQFVIEYVGEMLTQDQAQRYGQIYDEIKRSYLYDLDYPESKRTPDFTLDGFHASNVARFINHSCDANLKIYRVYVETTYKWLSHIGMYAMRDIEAGEELSYDYNYGRHDLQVHDGHSSNPEAGKQKIDQGNDSRHIKCHCGTKNCREWLWRPTHTGDESEEE